MTRSPSSSARAFLFVVVVIVFRWSSACYVYPPDVQDPCEDRPCTFGARCVPALDGLTSRCICPERCDNYGDSVGSTPVCGSDGKDYPNRCSLDKAACQGMQQITVAYEGKCGELTLAHHPYMHAPFFMDPSGGVHGHRPRTPPEGPMKKGPCMYG
jgi:hypothetical protein